MVGQNTGLESLSAAELGREVLSGRVSPTEVVRHFASRIAETPCLLPRLWRNALPPERIRVPLRGFPLA